MSIRTTARRIITYCIQQIVKIILSLKVKVMNELISIKKVKVITGEELIW